jgi:hypothetical protein
MQGGVLNAQDRDRLATLQSEKVEGEFLLEQIRDSTRLEQEHTRELEGRIRTLQSENEAKQRDKQLVQMQRITEADILGQQVLLSIRMLGTEEERLRELQAITGVMLDEEGLRRAILAAEFHALSARREGNLELEQELMMLSDRLRLQLETTEAINAQTAGMMTMNDVLRSTAQVSMQVAGDLSSVLGQAFATGEADFQRLVGSAADAYGSLYLGMAAAQMFIPGQQGFAAGLTAAALGLKALGGALGATSTSAAQSVASNNAPQQYHSYNINISADAERRGQQRAIREQVALGTRGAGR